MPPAIAAVAVSVFSASAAFTGGIGLFGVTLIGPGFAAAAIAGVGSFALGFLSNDLPARPPR